MVEEEEDEQTVADGEKLAALRNELFGAPDPLELADATDDVKATAPYSGLAEEESEETPTSDGLPAGIDEHTLGASASVDASALFREIEESRRRAFEVHAMPELHAEQLEQEHTLNAAPAAAPSHQPEQDTERWFEQTTREPHERTPVVTSQASTLHGATPPQAFSKDHHRELFDDSTRRTSVPKSPQTADGSSTYLFVVLDVEAPRGGGSLRKSKRMLALEGLQQRLAELLREAGMVVEESDEERIIASIAGDQQGVSAAIVAAKQLIDEVNRYDSPIPARIRLRCVVSTVTDALGHPRERAQAIAGRLLRGMPVDRIWLDWTSFCALEQKLRCQEVVLPSLEEPAYEVEGLEKAIAMPTPQTEIDRLEPLWIGRRQELDALHQQWRAVVAGEARVVLVLGAPGSGRTRLLQTFTQEITHEAQFFFGSSDSCPIENNSSPYLAGLLLSHLERHQIDRHQELFHRLSALEGEAGASSEFDVQRRFEQLLALSAEGPKGEDGAAEEALAWYIQASATQTPTMVVFDDIFLIDRRTHRLLANFLKHPPARTMLVFLSSPGEYEDVLFSSMSQAHRIDLAPFSAEESRQLLNSLRLPNDLSHQQIERMVQEAEGNPQLLVTLARATHKSQRREITWSYDLSVPNAVERLMLQRLHGLSHLEKDTLRKAAVIGDRFWKGAVECLERLDLNDGSWGLREGVVISHVDDRSGCLKQLLEKELIEEVPHSSLPREREYRFPHRLLRRSLMRQIPLSIRKQMHRRIAQWLSLRDEAHVQAFEIARHLDLAGDREGAAWRLFESARDLLREERRIQALSLLAEALEMVRMRNPVLRLRLLQLSANTYFEVGDIAAAVQLNQDALQLSWRLTSAWHGAKAFIALSRCLALRGEFEKAQGHILDAEALAQQVEDNELLAEARLQGVCVQLWQGELEEAEAQMPGVHAVLRLLRETHPLLWAELLGVEGWLYRLKGLWRDANKRLQEASALYSRHGDLLRYANTLKQQAAFYITAGDEETAVPLLEEAIELLRRREAYRSLQEALLLSAQMSLGRRDTHKTMSLLKEAWQHTQIAGEPLMTAQIAAALAATYALLRQPDDAIHFAKIAFKQMKEGPLQPRAMIYFFLGEATTSMTPAQIEKMFDPMPSRLPEGGMPTFLFLKAVELFKRAKESARQIGTLLSLGRSLLIGGHTQTAINVLERGIADANRVGLGLLLERLKNQRRLLSRNDAIDEQTSLSSDPNSSTLVVRKSRLDKKEKRPFASETQARSEIHRSPSPYSKRTANPPPYGGVVPHPPVPLPPSHPQKLQSPFSPDSVQSSSHPHQSTDILPSPKRSPDPKKGGR